MKRILEENINFEVYREGKSLVKPFILRSNNKKDIIFSS